MKFSIEVPVCRQRRSKEGFYLLINGMRIHHRKRSSAIDSARALLDMQRMQIVTVRQYAARKKRP